MNRISLSVILLRDTVSELEEDSVGWVYKVGWDSDRRWDTMFIVMDSINNQWYTSCLWGMLENRVDSNGNIWISLPLMGRMASTDTAEH